MNINDVKPIFDSIKRTDKQVDYSFGSYNEAGITYNETGYTYGGLYGTDKEQLILDAKLVKPQ